MPNIVLANGLILSHQHILNQTLNQQVVVKLLCEAATIFDPQRLVGIIEELNGQLAPGTGGKAAQDEQLANRPGTLYSARPSMTHLRNRDS